MVSITGLFTIFLFTGYLFGSISSAIVVCRLMGLPDPRTQGSNNPGATNVMRIGGKKAAALTFVGDFLKGLLPVLIAKVIISDHSGMEATQSEAMAGAALGAFLGHLYPLYFGFKGGKGIATLVGLLLAISPLFLLVFAGVFFPLVFATGYVSLASLLGTVGVFVFSLFFDYNNGILAVLLLVTILVTNRHRTNIKRLLEGSENKIKFGKKD